MTTPQRVLIDATAIPSDLGGVGRYLQFLIPALARLDDLEVIVVAQSSDAQWMSEAAPSARIVALPARFTGRAARLIWEQTGLPALARKLGVSAIHSPHYTMPLATSIPVIVTFHDATFFSHPEVHSRFKRVFFRSWTRLSARRAVAYVVPSAATGSEVRRYVGRTRGAETVAYHGVDSTMFSVPGAAAIAEVASELSLPADGWLSFLGTIEPRKNLPNLIRAYAALAQRRAVPPLIIAGARGWDDETAGLVAALPDGADVRLVGYLPAGQLAGLLGGSQIFVYPSLGEGFGLPVLEAMASGAATLTTDKLALPEVGGDAVAYTGTSAGEIAEALERLLDDPAERARLAAAGIARAAEFTWDRSAIAHREAYRTARRLHPTRTMMK